MFWIIGLIALFFLVRAIARSGSQNANATSHLGATQAQIEAKLNNEMPVLFSANLQKLLREEYPEIADRFTTTTCLSAYDTSIEEIKRKTGGNDFVDIVKRLQAMPESQSKAIEDEADRLAFEAMPEDVRQHVHNAAGGYEHYMRTVKAASDVTLAEFQAST